MGALSSITTAGDGGTSPHRTIKSWEPATGGVLGEVPITSPEDVKRTIARARKAQAAWGVLPVEERCARLLRFRDAMVEHVEELVEVVSRECGKPRGDALSEAMV